MYVALRRRRLRRGLAAGLGLAVALGLPTTALSAGGPAGEQTQTAPALEPDATPSSPTGVLLPYSVATPPVVVLPVLDGPVFDLGRLRGEVVLVHVFATWCEPCREELPALSRLAERYAGRLTVIGIDVGEVDVRVRRFFAELPVSFPILLDRDRAVSRAWSVSALPTTFVLDRALVPRLRAVGDVAWDAPDTEARLALVLASAASRGPAASEGPPRASSSTGAVAGAFASVLVPPVGRAGPLSDVIPLGGPFR